MIPRWRVLGLLALAATLLAPGAAWSAQAVAVQLSWQHQFQFAGYYVAKARGYYDAAGLDVELRPGGPKALHPIDAVSSERAEFGVGTSGLAVERMGGAPLVVLAALLQSSPAVWVAPGRLEGMSLEAWRALPRRLPLRPSDSTELLIPLSLPGAPATAQPVSRRGALTDVFTSGPPELHAVYSSTEVIQLARRGIAHTVLDPRDFGVNFYGEVLFTSASVASRHPSAVQRFREATLRGWREAFADIEGTARLVQQDYAPSLTLEQLVEEGRALRRLARVDEIELGHMSRSRWEAIGKLQREHGFGREPLDVDSFVYQAASPSSLLWPDPVRVTLGGLLVALLLSGGQLLRINGRLIRENSELSAAGRGQQVAEIRFQFLMDVAPFPIAIYELEDGVVRYANDRALGWAHGADMVGKPVQGWLPALAPGDTLAGRLRSGRALREQEMELPAAGGGDSRWCAVNGRAIEHDGCHCAFIAFVDITDRKASQREVELLSEQRAMILRDVEVLQARLRETSLRDALTGLYNRRYFDVTAEREFARCRRERQSVAMLVVDADHFKKVNDTHGHAVGDQVLRALATVLATAFRGEDVVCRYGGEEFVVLMPGADTAAALARGEALRRAVSECQVSAVASSVRFSVSVGAAVGDPSCEDPAAVFARADEAVYAAKAAGRNCVRLAQPPLLKATLPVSSAGNGAGGRGAP